MCVKNGKTAFRKNEGDVGMRKSVWTEDEIKAAMKNHQGSKYYRCNVNGSDALGFDGPAHGFTVVAKSVTGPIHPNLDDMARAYRERLEDDDIEPTTSFAFKEDFTYSDAALAAWVVCGCPSDELAWVAADGSHPL